MAKINSMTVGQLRYEVEKAHRHGQMGAARTQQLVAKLKSFPERQPCRIERIIGK